MAKTKLDELAGPGAEKKTVTVSMPIEIFSLLMDDYVQNFYGGHTPTGVASRFIKDSIMCLATSMSLMNGNANTQERYAALQDVCEQFSDEIHARQTMNLNWSAPEVSTKPTEEVAQDTTTTAVSGEKPTKHVKFFEQKETPTTESLLKAVFEAKETPQQAPRDLDPPKAFSAFVKEDEAAFTGEHEQAVVSTNDYSGKTYSNPNFFFRE